MIFEVGDYRGLLDEFVRCVPQLLFRHPETRDLAPQLIARLDALKEQPLLTLAVVGQQKAAKSTLVNALLGCDVAPVGMTPTTATKTMIERGSGRDLDSFVIDWGTGRERRPIADLQQFFGRGSLAEKANSLTLRADSPVLDRVRIVDAPGKNSVDKAHEAAADRILSADIDRMNALTDQASAQADAILHVLPYDIKERDLLIQDQFGTASRLYGVGGYNSLAVVQKWDATLGSVGGPVLADDPVARVEAKLSSLSYHLKGKVAAILPVSGMLAQMATVPDDDLDRLVFLAARVDDTLLEKLLGDEDAFLNQQGAPLSPAERAGLQDRIDTALGGRWKDAVQSWPAIRMSLWLVRRNSLADGRMLATALRRTSRIDELHELLQQRFFAFSDMIRTGRLIAQVLQPCMAAIARLRQAEDDRTRLVSRGRALRKSLLGQMGPADDNLRLFIDGCMVSLDRSDAGPAIAALCKLSTALDASFRRLLDDTDLLNVLGQGALDELGDAEHQALHCLFGGHRLDAASRLDVPAGSGEAACRARGHELIGKLQRSRLSLDPRVRHLAIAGQSRINLILDAIDTRGMS